MKKYTHFTIPILFFSLIFILMACSDQNDKAAGEEKADIQEERKKLETEANDKKTEHNEEVHAAPNDQGNMEVWLDGELNVSSKVITAKGMTNLLPGSQLSLSTKTEKGVLIGGNDTTVVDENGMFALEAKLPDGVEGILHTEISFQPQNQDSAIADHYKDGLTGDFARAYTDLEKMYNKASFISTVSLDEGEQNIAIVAPSWDVPEDYGDTSVWIEPEIQQGDEYVIVKMKSNIIDGTFIRAKADIPNYITSGFQGTGYTNPDGTAEFYVENPYSDSRIKDITTYEIVIQMSPAEGNNGPSVTELYGEAGEKLSGELVKKEGDGQLIEKRVKVKVD